MFRQRKVLGSRRSLREGLTNLDFAPGASSDGVVAGLDMRHCTAEVYSFLSLLDSVFLQIQSVQAMMLWQERMNLTTLS